MLWMMTMVWAGPADTLGDPEAAARVDYCAWHAGAEADEVAALEAQVASHEDAAHGLGASARLIDAGVRIAAASASTSACHRTFRKGAAVDERAYRKRLGGLRSGHTPSDDPAVAEIQDRIGTLWATDQAARRVYLASQTDDEVGPRQWARQLAAGRAAQADTASTAAMREIVAQEGWPDAPRFGEPVSRHAWLLVQHADAHPDFQAEVLALMEPLVASGGVRTEDYAFLFDRVAVNHDRLQRYGTQPTWTCNAEGALELAPLEAPEDVDARRAEMGLGPVEESLAEMTRAVCR